MQAWAAHMVRRIYYVFLYVSPPLRFAQRLPPWSARNYPIYLLTLLPIIGKIHILICGCRHANLSLASALACCLCAGHN